MKFWRNKYTLLIATLVVLASAAFGGIAYANPFYEGTQAKTAVATSTVAYLTPGTATTTPVYDSFEQYGTNQTNGGNVTLPNVVSILMQGAASSTATNFSVACEFSDNYNGVSGDWYQDEITATTTTAQNIAQPVSFSFQYASSTVGGAPVQGNTNRYGKVFQCPVPVRFVRAVITVTGANGSVWAAIVPTKQRN